MSKSHSKSRKPRQPKGKHGGLPAKTPMEWKPAAMTMKEQKPLYHYVWDLGRMLFSSGPRENKEPSLSSERPDVAWSSSTLAASSGANVAAKRASTIHDKISCHAPDATGNSNEASELVLEPEFSKHNRVMAGENFSPHRGGCSRKEEAQVSGFERLPVDEYDDLKNEHVDLKKEHVDLKKEHDDLKKELDDLKKEHDDLKKKHVDLKKEHDDLKKEDEFFDIILQLRRLLSNFPGTPEGKIIIDRIKKEVLELPAAKSEKIDDILKKTSYTKTLRTMHFQGANMALKSKFRSRVWRDDNRFPSFKNDDADYQWWDQNFDLKILEKRLGIFREAAEKSNRELDMFMIIKLVSDLNSKLHPQPNENEPNEKDEVKMLRLLTKIRDLVGPERFEELRKTRFAGP